MEQYLVVIERGRQNYSAYSPDVPGCVASGGNVEETLDNMQEALVSHLHGMIEDGDELLQPRGLLFYLSQGESIAEPGDLITYIDAGRVVVA